MSVATEVPIIANILTLRLTTLVQALRRDAAITAAIADNGLVVVSLRTPIQAMFAEDDYV